MAENNPKQRGVSEETSSQRPRGDFATSMGGGHREKARNNQVRFERLRSERDIDRDRAEEKQEQLVEEEQLTQVKREAAGEFRRTAEAFYSVATESKIKAPYEAIKLGAYLRKRMREGSSSAWEIAYGFALLIDGVDFIPVAGWIVTLFLKPALFMMLWGFGSWKVKAVRLILILIDSFPVINMLPWSFLSVVYSHRASKKEARRAEKELKELKMQFEEI